MPHHRRTLHVARAVTRPAALALAAGLLLPAPATAAPTAAGPTALLVGELVLVADAHRTDDPSEHADELTAHLRLADGLAVPLETALVGDAAPGSRVTVEVPVPAAVVAAVRAGSPVPVPAPDAPAPPAGGPATQTVVIPVAALDAAATVPAPATSDLAEATAVSVAAADDLGATSVVAATDPAPVAATSAPKQVTAVVVGVGGRTDARYTDAEVSRLLGAASDYWSEQSDGAISFTQAGATTRYTSAVPCGSHWNLWGEAGQRAGFPGGPNSFLVLFLPPGAGCSYGLGSIGGGPGSGGSSYVSDTSWPALAHELGHNMSLMHADRAVCGSAADAAKCTEQAYGDSPDVMASSSLNAAGNTSTLALGRLGVLPAGDRVAITATGVTTVTLAPLSDHAGLRSASVVDPRSGTTYYLENRQNTGRDTYAWGPWPGLRVMRFAAGQRTLVLDASPTTGRDPDVVVRPGATFSSVKGGVQVRTRTEASGAVTASVSVAPTGAAHWLTGPFATTVVPAAAPKTAAVDVPLTLTGKVTGPPGRVPPGTVTASSPSGASATAPVAANGAYSLAWTPTRLGKATVTLTYAPIGTDFITSAKAVTTSVVAPTQVVATSPNATVAAGATSVLPVTVSAPAHPGVVPAGTVTVSEGTKKLASGALVGGSASVKLPVLVGGTHPLTVAFVPAAPTAGPTTAPSSTSASVTVARAAATVKASLAATDVAAADAGKVAVTVTVPGVTPTGAVTVSDGATTVGTATLSAGGATVTLARLPTGFHDLVVSYGGEARALPAQSAPVRLEVTALPRSRVTATVAKTTTAAQPVVAVKVATRGAAATGTVTVTRGGAVVGTGTLVKGAVSVRLPLQGAGTAPLLVRHDSSASVEGGTATVSIVVTPAKPTLTTALSATTKAKAATATMAVTVSSPAGTPTGQVKLLTGSTVLGTATLVGGAATLTVPSTLPVGKRSLTVTYTGSTELLAVTSATRTLTVTA